MKRRHEVSSADQRRLGWLSLAVSAFGRRQAEKRRHDIPALFEASELLAHSRGPTASTQGVGPFYASDSLRLWVFGQWRSRLSSAAGAALRGSRRKLDFAAAAALLGWCKVNRLSGAAAAALRGRSPTALLSHS